MRGKQNGQLAYDEMLNFIGHQRNGYPKNDETRLLAKIRTRQSQFEENVGKWEFSTVWATM